jgi:hypothetical protein
MERQFLLYILYITLVEMREQAYEQDDKRTYWLCNLLHNVPMALESAESTLSAPLYPKMKAFRRTQSPCLSSQTIKGYVNFSYI